MIKYLYKIFVFITGLIFLLLIAGLLIARAEGVYLITPGGPAILMSLFLFIVIFSLVSLIKKKLKKPPIKNTVAK